MKFLLKVVVVLCAFMALTGNPPRTTEAQAPLNKADAVQTAQQVTTQDNEIKPQTQEPVVTQPVEQKPQITPTDHGLLMTAAGISPEEQQYADYIISHESTWCHTRWQGYHGSCQQSPTENIYGNGAYGLCQSLPGSKMASAGADYMTNPVTQLRWCDTYAHERYGGWYGAYQHWIAKSWW